jgi:hypothetical protein
MINLDFYREMSKNKRGFVKIIIAVIVLSVGMVLIGIPIRVVALAYCFLLAIFLLVWGVADVID